MIKRFKTSELYNLGLQELQFQKSANLKPIFERAEFNAKIERDGFDIFICHSSSDKEMIYGMFSDLKRRGYIPYVDWIIDPELDRTKVTAHNANTIRKRIRQSKNMIFVNTPNSISSHWMPWELGYMDGIKPNRIAVTILEDANGRQYGREFLELYPAIDPNTDSALFVEQSEGVYVGFNEWLNGKQPYKRTPNG